MFSEAERVYQRWLGSVGLSLPLSQMTRKAFRIAVVFSVDDALL